MIIGDNKEQIIENIQRCVEEGKFNDKVEVDDPSLSLQEKKELIAKYLNKRNKLGYKICNKIARVIINMVTWSENRDTEIEGIENIAEIKSGAIITSNHFNPLDNTVVRKFTKKIGKSRLYIVSQDTNLAMKGIIGFIMNYADIIPISSDNTYMRSKFLSMVEDIISKNQFILIYPEQEMWFNYRKPRPLKRGAYYYAAKFNVPIISCFVEIKNIGKKENKEFYKSKYVMHVLKPIYPDANKSIRENSIMMMNKDYEQKVEAYEKAYGKKIQYDFAYDDIAGWIPKSHI